MVRHTLHTEDETLPVRLVHASRGKMARAEPVSALYEQNRVKHVRGLNDLEDQMVQWEPLGSIGSPDRLDALVWAITDLSLNGYAKPQLKLAYSSAKGLTMILRKLNVKLTLWKVSLMIWITVLTITLQNLYRRCRMALLGLRSYISGGLAQLRDRLRKTVSTLMDAWVYVKLLAVRLGQSLGLM